MAAAARMISAGLNSPGSTCVPSRHDPCANRKPWNACDTSPGVWMPAKWPELISRYSAPGICFAMGFDRGWRAQPVVRAGDHQRGAGDARKLLGHRGIRQHAVDRGEAARIVGQPARTEFAELLGVVADLGRIGIGEAGFHQRTHALRLGGRGAIQRGLAAIRGDAGGRTGHHQRAGACRVTHGEVDRDGAAHGRAGQRDLALNAQCIQQCCEVVGHVVEADAAVDLPRQSGAARIVAQHLARVVQRREHLVPAIERAAHLMHQNQRRLAAARQVVAQAGFVQLDPVHRVSSVDRRMPH